MAALRRSRRRRARAARSRPGGGRDSRPARASRGSAAPGRRAATRAERSDARRPRRSTSPFARAIESAAARSSRSAPIASSTLAHTFVLSSTTDACSSVFNEPGQVESLGALAAAPDRVRRLERRRVEDHHLLLDAERERAATPRSALRSLADAVHRTACGLPRVVRRARAVVRARTRRRADCVRPPSRAARGGGDSDRRAPARRARDARPS